VAPAELPHDQGDAPGFSREVFPMKAVLTAASPTDAALIKNMLEERGIPSSLIEARGYAGAPYAEVWVNRDEDSDRAVEAIRLLRSNAPEPGSWTCASCGETNPGTFDVCWKCTALL
jgi:hypothetical protein